jgi:hypothetical protein
MVFTIPKAHQPFFLRGLVMHRTRRQINASRLGRQGIGPDHVLPELSLKGVAGSGLGVPHLAQHHRQPVIGAIVGADRFPQGLAQAGEMLRGPLFDRTQKMRAPHDHMGNEH